MGTLCSVTGKKYRWYESKYDAIMRLCLSLANLPVSNHPLQEDHFVAFCKLRRILYHIGDDTSNKRERQKEKYRNQRWVLLCDDSDDYMFENDINKPWIWLFIYVLPHTIEMNLEIIKNSRYH